MCGEQDYGIPELSKERKAPKPGVRRGHRQRRRLVTHQKDSYNSHFKDK